MSAAAVLVAACATPAAQDVERYTAVVADASVEPTAGMAACGALEDPDLAGDCALHVATVEGRRPAGRPDLLCPGLAAGPWRDECWFVAAEAMRARGNDQAAAHLCLRAGGFKDDCAQHLWQSAVHALTWKGPPGFVHVVGRARRLHDRWAPLLGEGTDFETRFWSKFYANGFESRGVVDLAWCDALSADDATRCVAAGLEVYARDFFPRIERSGVDLCSLSSPTAADLLPASPCRPDPRIDAVVARLWRDRCG